MTRIVNIIEKTISVASGIRNADINFNSMTGSVVAMVTDTVRKGRPLTGVAFDSIGRYGHGALMRERFVPRIMNASPEQYSNPAGPGISPGRLRKVLMANEKAGGHGERAGAVGLLDAAAWDLQAKIENKPLWALINQSYPGAETPSKTRVYASGGHYRSSDNLEQLKREISSFQNKGYERFKIKAGGLPMDEDLQRIETTIGMIGDGGQLAIDLNTGLTDANATDWLRGVEAYQLAWVEEPVEPLDYQRLSELCDSYSGAISTGENLFSFYDARNLLRYGGMRPEKDFLNFDISLSYGLVEYFKILNLLAELGWSRKACQPHAGYLLAAHAAAGLGLGGHEIAPEHHIFGRYPDDCAISNGFLQLGDRPGSGLEDSPSLKAVFEKLLS